jgi:hypothetical protein
VCYNFAPLTCPPPTNLCAESVCDPVEGGCVTSLKNCNDNNPCTLDSCSIITGQCINTALVCEGDILDLCVEGYCNPVFSNCDIRPIVCNDFNDCTLDSCDSDVGCVYIPIPGDPACTTCTTDGQCNDLNDCTADRCDLDLGICYNTPRNCSDDNFCTSDFCDVATDECYHEPVFCNDELFCTVDSCNPLTGECVFDPYVCTDDGNACTLNLCREPVSGVDPGMPICDVNQALVCDDENPCTVDTCNPATGCVYTERVCEPPVGSDICEIGFCDPDTGECASATRDCDTGNPCALGECSLISGECEESLAPECQACTTSATCNDNDPCTDDTCQTFGDISYCAYAPKLCDDGIGCTINSCNPNTGACVFTPFCEDDGNPCTITYCDLGVGLCLASPKICEPPDACHVGSCNPDTGNCEYERLPGCCITVADCDDSDLCSDDFCVTGQCTYVTKTCQDFNTCTADSCNPISGECVFAQIPGCCVSEDDCDDGNPCTVNTCLESVCQPPTTRVCFDADPCTIDTCVPAEGGCVHEEVPIGVCCYNEFDCDDDDPCTTNSCMSNRCQFVGIPGCG